MRDGAQRLQVVFAHRLFDERAVLGVIGQEDGDQRLQRGFIIIEQSAVPVVVDAGLGGPGHAAEAMERGADAVLVNTAIASAGDPVAMAAAFRMAVEAGRIARLARLAPVAAAASATSPLTAFLEADPA